MKSLRTVKIKSVHPLQWVFEPFETETTFLQKKMFGCEAAYLWGQLCLVLAAGEEPWNGIMICTSRDFHDSLVSDFPQIRPHSVLGKWLYLSQTDPDFEEVSSRVVERILRRDARIGVESKPKRKRKSARSSKKK